MADAPYLLVRAASLYVAVVLSVITWAWRRPHRRAVAGALLAFIWNLPALLFLQLAAARFGWWHFDAQGGELLGMPVDLYLAWAWLWGAIPALALASWPIGVVLVAAVAVDLTLMPAAAPVLRLGPAWLAGEAAGLVAGLLPAQLLARWTAADRCLAGRALLQVVAFIGLFLFVLPAIAIEGSGTAWVNPLARPVWQVSLIAQGLAIPAVVGLTAVHEFVTRGGGTPVPFDPPRTLVTSGVYAYVRNPMQLSAVMLLLLLGIVVHNPWVAAAGVMAHLYSAGLAGWDEDEDLRRRFGEAWTIYRRNVPAWRPRLRPWWQPDQRPARLFVAEGCGMCRDVARWFASRHAQHLVVVAAETHPSGALRRVTYEPGDGGAASGIEAIARGLEHIHLGWAFVGFLLRLPVIRDGVQLLADASGAAPRTLAGGAAGLVSRPTCPSASESPALPPRRTACRRAGTNRDATRRARS